MSLCVWQQEKLPKGTLPCLYAEAFFGNSGHHTKFTVNPVRHPNVIEKACRAHTVPSIWQEFSTCPQLPRHYYLSTVGPVHNGAKLILLLDAAAAAD
jgi:hypothetical protein